MVLKNLFARQHWRNRHREQTYGHRERGGEGEIYGKSNMETYIQFSSVAQSCPTLCNPIDYHSAIKRNAFESVLMRWMNLEPIIQSEISQKEK